MVRYNLLNNFSHSAIRSFELNHVNHNRAIIAGFEVVYMFHHLEVTFYLLVHKHIWFLHVNNLCTIESGLK